MTGVLDIAFGRQAFGADPEAYELARPAYPEAIFAILRKRCGLRAGIAAFEIGPGPGGVTQRLFDGGAGQVAAIEPDGRLAAHLRRRFAERSGLEVIEAPFEDAELPIGGFELGVAATSFHWVDQRSGLAKVAEALKPGGWWACWWNTYGGGVADDPFMTATAALFHDVPRTHNASRNDLPFELDTHARLENLRAEGRLIEASAEVFRWDLTLSAEQIRALYATYSPIVAMETEARRRFLDGVHEIAVRDFGGYVEKQMSAALYTAQRR